MKHILAACDLTRADLEQVLTRADELARDPQPILQNKTIAIVSDGNHLKRYHNAIRAAGAQILEFQDLQGLAAGPGQRLGDLDAAIVGPVRSSQPISTIPLINANEEADESPLPALVELYVIRQAKGTLDGLAIALLGNLKGGAASHSLARWLGYYQVRLSFVSPAALSMPYDLSDDLRAAGIEVEETNDLAATLRKTDVLYFSRLDPSRIEQKIYDKARNLYPVSPALFEGANPELFVLGDWEGGDNILSAAQARVEQASRALLPALIEFARKS